MPKANGWVKIHRKILETELTASQFKFFVGAIVLAKTLNSPNPGLVDLSVRQLADELRMSRSEVWRREKELEEMEMLTLLDKGFTINNYGYYQTGKGVPPTGHTKVDNSITTVSPTGQEKETTVSPTGQEKETTVSPTGLNVPPTGLNVPPEGQSVPSRESESDNKNSKKKKNIKKNDLSNNFNIFWGAYPRKVAKSDAEKAFNKINPDEELLRIILDAISKATKSEGWLKESGKFIPHPTTWLNGKRWEDEVTVTATSVKSKFNDGWK